MNNATWDNLFVGIDSGRNDVSFSNITDIEQRKEMYDFASYRQDNLAFEVKKDSTWNFDDNYQNLAGTKVAVARAPTRRSSCWNGRRSSRPPERRSR